MKGSVGHSDSSCGEKENGHPTSRISCILQRLSLCSSQRKHSSPRQKKQLYRMCDSTPCNKVTARRPRRLRKRHPIPYRNNSISSHLILDVRSERPEKIWVWDSCSTIEPVVEMPNHKEDLESLEFDNSDELDSALPELFIGGTYHSNFVYTFPPSGLSSFVPHVLETIEEADVETREPVEFRRS